MNLKEAICQNLKNYDVKIECSETLLNLEIDRLILDEYKSELNLIGLSGVFFTSEEKNELKTLLKKLLHDKICRCNSLFMLLFVFHFNGVSLKADFCLLQLPL